MSFDFLSLPLPTPLLLFVRTIYLVYMMENPTNKMTSIKSSSGENASSKHLSAPTLFAFPKVWPENALRGNVGARATRNKYADVPFDALPSSAISRSIIIDNNITRRRSIITCERFAELARRGITPSVYAPAVGLGKDENGQVVQMGEGNRDLNAIQKHSKFV